MIRHGYLYTTRNSPETDLYKFISDSESNSFLAGAAAYQKDLIKGIRGEIVGQFSFDRLLNFIRLQSEIAIKALIAPQALSGKVIAENFQHLEAWYQSNVKDPE